MARVARISVEITRKIAMKKLFQIMADKKASDIFLSVGSPINIKINGVAMPVNQTTISGLVPQVTSGGSLAASSRIERTNTAGTKYSPASTMNSAITQCDATPTAVVASTASAASPFQSRALK